MLIEFNRINDLREEASTEYFRKRRVLALSSGFLNKKEILPNNHEQLFNRFKNRDETKVNILLENLVLEPPPHERGFLVDVLNLD